MALSWIILTLFRVALGVAVVINLANLASCRWEKCGSRSSLSALRPAKRIAVLASCMAISASGGGLTVARWASGGLSELRPSIDLSPRFPQRVKFGPLADYFLGIQLCSNFILLEASETQCPS